MITWKLETRKIKDLKEYSKNPRTLTHEQAKHLEKSLSKFGLIDKPIINTDNTIIGGHQRLRILKKLKLKEIECYVPDKTLDEKDVEELNIRLNKNTGEWDFDILANEWDVCELVEWGFGQKELELFVDGSLDEEKPVKEESCKCPTCGKKMKA
jgi:ParB-like chromosome segregation protein Spo0J